MMAAGEETATAFVETSLGTRIAVSFAAPNTTVAHLKRIVSDEHVASFPRTGQIAVEYFEVRRRGSWYRLTDSMPVRAAFNGVKGAWHLHAHVLLLPHSAPVAECGVRNVLHMLRHSQQNAIGDAAASAQGSDAPSTDPEDGHVSHLGDADEDGYSPVRGQGVIDDPAPRGTKRLGEKQDDEGRDQSVLVGCDDGGSLAAQNECKHNSMLKRICAARGGGVLDEVPANTVGGGGDVAAHYSDNEDEGALDDSCWLEKEEEAVSARPSDLAEPPADQFHDHETKSITNDEEPKLCFSAEPPADELHDHEAKSITSDEEPKLCYSAETPADQLHDHEAKSITNDQVPKLCFLVEPPENELHDHEAKSITNDEEPKLCFSVKPPVELCDHEAKSITNDEEPKLCFSVKPPMELRDHEDKSITNDDDPKLCFSVNKNDFAAATEKHADEGMAKEKLVEQQDHLDTSGAEVVLQNCDSKDTSAIHSEHVSDCHQHEGSSRSICKCTKCEVVLSDQVADRDRVCPDVERAPQEKENDHTSDPLLHDLDDCALSLGEEPICGQKEPPIPEVRNSASSKKGNDLPPCVETLKEVNSSEKEAMARKVKGKEPLTDKVCNGERGSSSKGTDRPACAGSMKEGKSSEKEEMAQKVKDKEPWTAKACNGERSSSKGSNQSTRTVTLVDVDGTKWEMELDDTFELGPQQSSSFSWSEKEDAEEIQNDSARPHQNAQECPEGAPENGGPRVPTERSDLPRHGSSFRAPTSIDPTELKHAGGTSADDAEQGAWEKRRRPRAAVRKIPNSRAAKMYGYR